jgi:hypothetical protein
MSGFDGLPSGRWIDPSFPDAATVTRINIASPLGWPNSVQTGAVRRPRAAVPVSLRTGNGAFVIAVRVQKEIATKAIGRSCLSARFFAGWTAGESVFDTR